MLTGHHTARGKQDVNLGIPVYHLMSESGPVNSRRPGHFAGRTQDTSFFSLGRDRRLGDIVLVEILHGENHTHKGYIGQYGMSYNFSLYAAAYKKKDRQRREAGLSNPVGFPTLLY